MIDSPLIYKLLALYAWFPLAALLMFMLLIARFYEKFSGKPMYFRGYFVPIILFGASAVIYANKGADIHDPLANVALGFGGISLLMLCGVMYWRMLR